MREKTNAMRLLERLSIPYRSAFYEYDAEHLDALHAASSLAVSPEKIYKTIVMKGASNKIYVFSLPSVFEVSLKKARELTDEKEILPVKTDELRRLTGYIRGGCSPLGMIKNYPVYLLDLAALEDEIYISAGERGVQLILRPNDLVKAVHAIYSDFV